MKFNNKLFTYISLFLLVLTSCGDSDKDKDDRESRNLFKFREYVQSVSRDGISVHEPIVIRLTEPVQDWTEGDILDKRLLDIQPSVDGDVVALDNHTIAFKPADKFEQDTEYRIDFHISRVKNLPEELETLTFYVRTTKLDYIVKMSPIQRYSKDFMYLPGEIIASDKISPSQAQTILTARSDNKDFDIEYGGHASNLSKSISFKIDSIPRRDNDYKIEVSWKGESLSVDTQGTSEINIPGRNSFQVTEVELIDVQEQKLVFSFSDPVSPDQNLDGLIEIDGVNNYRYDIAGNEVTLYPDSRIQGSRKIEVFKNIKSVDGFSLKTPYSATLAFEQTDPQIKFVQTGNILPTSSQLKVNFKSVNLRAVDVWVFKIYDNNILQFLQQNDLGGDRNLRQVSKPIAHQVIDLQQGFDYDLTQWNTFAVDLSEIMQVDTDAIYRIELGFQHAYSVYDCTGSSLEQPKRPDFKSEIDTKPSWDAYQDHKRFDYRNYRWRERENPCSPSFYRNVSVATNLLASNLGAIVKKGESGGYFVAVTNLLTTKPLGGARIDFYDFQQQKLFRGRTDPNGTAFFKNVGNASFVKITYKEDKTYVKLGDGNSLPISKFDTRGEKLEDGLQGFLYADRGVHRPGDKIYLDFILNDQENPLPEDHPVTLELSDPQGKKTFEQTVQNGVNGFYHFEPQTSSDSPTGIWKAKVTVGAVTFTKRLPVETIKPNRLKVNLELGKPILKAGKSLEATLTSRWLHGAKARNLEAEVELKLRPLTTRFDDFAGYKFDDITRKFETQETQIFNGKVNSEGTAEFEFKPNLDNRPAGMLTASFLSKVYENGGDFSIDVTSKKYSPFEGYVGISVPESSSWDALELDKDYTVGVAAVTPQGEARSSDRLDISVYKIEWRWWWQSGIGQLNRFHSDKSKNLVYQTRVKTDSKGRGSFNLTMEYPKYGRYLIRIVDPETGHAASDVVYFSYPGWYDNAENNTDMASMLFFEADKESYTVGDRATITFPTAAAGRALLTLENGSTVLSHQWIETEKGQSQISFTIEEEHVPNIYAHISYMQPHAQTENDLPIRQYGVIPIFAENKQTHLNPQIKMPSTLKPESTAQIKVSERDGLPMTYTIAIVDEGLLDLTNFNTPDPWKKFFARQALGVKTWDLFDDVLGAYGGRIDQVFSIGGDATANGAKAKKANRFKPMVRHLGPFRLKPGATATHKVDIPRYVGSVRTMVVAGNIEKEAYGSAEVTTQVKKPLMLLTSLPRKLTPGETIQLPISVFAMDSRVKNVNVKVASSDYFEMPDGNTKNLRFEEPGDQIVFIPLKVKQTTGIAEIKVSARSGSESAEETTEIDVVNPNPFTTETERFIVEDKKSYTVKPFGVEGSNTATVTFSKLPPMNLERRLDYLIRYPHGCVEQITSSAFPQLFLADIVEISNSRQNKTRKHVLDVIDRLGRMQQPGGGFSYWPGHNKVSDWGTNYAGHFLLEAAQKGYTMPLSFKSSFISYQKRQARSWRNRGHDSANFVQAYRLYTLALAGEPDLSSMNRLRSIGVLDNRSKLRLSAAYALAGQRNAAIDLYNSANIHDYPAYGDWYTYGSPDRNRAMAFETMVILEKKEDARELAEVIAEAMRSERWMSTQTTAFSLTAMSKFAKLLGGDGLQLEYTFKGNTQRVKTSRSTYTDQLPVGTTDQPIEILNLNNGDSFFATVTRNGKLPVGEEKAISSNLKLTTRYTGKNGDKIDINNLIQGTEIQMKVTATNTGKVHKRNIALTKILPSGWEILNTRYTDFGASQKNPAEYIDIRDDRVHYYFDLKKDESKTFAITVNAGYLGRFYLPGAEAEAMYDNDYLARTRGEWIQISRD